MQWHAMATMQSADGWKQRNLHCHCKNRDAQGKPENCTEWQLITSGHYVISIICINVIYIKSMYTYVYIYKLKIIVTSYDMYMICIESIWIIYTLPKSISILQLAVLFARAFSTMPRSSSVRNASYGSEPCVSGASANVKKLCQKTWQRSGL